MCLHDAIMPIRWDNSTSTLTIGSRQGSYSGMPALIKFHVVLIRNGHRAGEGVTTIPDRTINYNGKETSVEVQP